MAIDYAGLNSGVSRGMMTGMNIVRQKQQDDRLVRLDEENREIRQEERGMRVADRAYQQEERTYAKEKRGKADASTEAQRRADMARLVWTDIKTGKLKDLDPAQGLSAMNQLVEMDSDIVSELVGGNPKVAGWAGFQVAPPESQYAGQILPMVRMIDGTFEPVTDDRSHEGKPYIQTPEQFLEGYIRKQVGQGAKFEPFAAGKAAEVKTIEVGDPKNPNRKIVVNATTGEPIGGAMNLWNPNSGSGGGGGRGDLPAEAQMVEYYKRVLGTSYENAVDLVKKGKTSPVDLAVKIYGEMKKNNDPLSENGLSEEELQVAASSTADFFFEKYAKTGKSPAAPLSGMAFAPSLQTRPPYQGPVRAGGMARNPQIEEAQVIAETPRRAAPVKGGVKAKMQGDKVTFGGKQYQAVNGIVTIDGKKYRVQ